MEPNEEFRKLEEQIVLCRRCSRLVEWRERVAIEKVRRFNTEDYWGRPVPAFGQPDGELVVIGLAPAAHGGNRTGRLFTGDRSGEWLYDALYQFGFANQAESINKNDGLQLHNCLITAVLRCAPPKNRPLPEEIVNCREYLHKELQLALSKRIIVTLGQIAFNAFLKTWHETGEVPIDQKLKFRHGGEWILPGGIILISSYHPSQQNTQTGKLTRPMFYEIFRQAAARLNSNR
jgi:uracil-DNA glycosylase